MIKKTLLFLIVAMSFAACNKAEKKVSETQLAAADSTIVEQDSTDAITGASDNPATVLGITKQAGLTMVYDFLKEGQPFYLATVENGKPCVRPIGLTHNFEGKLWFHIGKYKASYKQIQKNPNVEISSVNSKGQSIRVYGKAVCMDNDSLTNMIFKAYPDLAKRYSKEEGHELGHFYISDGIADINTDTTTVIVKF